MPLDWQTGVIVPIFDYLMSGPLLWTFQSLHNSLVSIAGNKSCFHWMFDSVRAALCLRNLRSVLFFKIMRSCWLYRVLASRSHLNS